MTLAGLIFVGQARALLQQPDRLITVFAVRDAADASRGAYVRADDAWPIHPLPCTGTQCPS